MANPKVFMDIEIAGAAAGRIVFELFADTTPKTAKNFRALCTGEKGHGRSGKPLHYKGLNFQHFFPGQNIWAFGNQESIYGGDFEDESYVNKHHKGTLSMGRHEHDKCNSGFFICLSEQSYWDGKRAAFGRIIEGMNVVQAIENCGNITGVVIADCDQLIENIANPKVFMDIDIAGAAAGRIVFELFADTTPKTAENFRALCTGEKGHGKSGKALHYKGLHFQHFFPGKNIWAFGNQESIYGGDFEDESYVNKHHKGTLSMGRFEHDKCNSGFFICLSEQSYWDGKRAAFGRIIEGMDVVQAIENCGNITGVVIADCGQLNIVNPKVFMDIDIAGAAAGRIVFELFADTTPKTAENFRALCTGEKGHGKSGKPLHYKGLHFQHFYPGENIWAFGNQESIYGEDFEDESYVNRHHKGTLSMGRFEHDKCNSGFFICLSELSYWDGKRAAFGKIIEGMDVVQAIENCGNITGVVIADCGQLIEEEEEEEEEEPY